MIFPDKKTENYFVWKNKSKKIKFFHLRSYFKKNQISKIYEIYVYNIYVYIYVCMYVCVCIWLLIEQSVQDYTRYSNHR